MALSAISAYDSDFYCENQEKLCDGFPLPHIGCGDGDWGYNCGDDRTVVRMTQAYRDLIVGTHNQYRSRVATGNIKDGAFGTAAKMGEIKWSPILADLAERNAKRCRQSHSPCRNTPEFKMAGECNGLQDGGKSYPDRARTMKMFMKAWFDEYKDTEACDIKSTPLNYA
jgi:Cysteine-rich secretory protein family